MLAWVAAARASPIPPASAGREGAILVGLGCGAGFLAPYLGYKGYRHIGIDVATSALRKAAAYGMSVVRGDVLDIPLESGIAAVVSAGEILEHVTDLASGRLRSVAGARPWWLARHWHYGGHQSRTPAGDRSRRADPRWRTTGDP